jgi:hypothetical protein
MNMENLIMLVLTFIPIGFIFIFGKHLARNLLLFKFIIHNIDYIDIIANQCISYVPNIILPLSAIMFYSYQQDSQDMVNITLSISLIGVSIIFPFLVLGFNPKFKVHRLLVKTKNP